MLILHFNFHIANHIQHFTKMLIIINVFFTLNVDDVKVTHMDLELDISFDTKILSGHVVLSVEKVNAEANSLVS